MQVVECKYSVENITFNLYNIHHRCNSSSLSVLFDGLESNLDLRAQTWGRRHDNLDYKIRTLMCLRAASSQLLANIDIDTQSRICKRGTSLVAQWLRIAYQCRGHRFEPSSGKIPHATEQLSPCATTTEPALYSPRATTIEPARLETLLCNKRSHHNEKPTHHNEE